MASPERRHTGLRVALATALGFSGAAGAVLAGKAILEGISRQPVSASENQEGGIMPSVKTFNELVTQTPFPITPTVTETPTQEPTASNTPTETATKPASTATATATATEIPTQEPTKIPATATAKPTEVPARPSPAPTAAPVEQPTPVPPTPESKPEIPSAAFPKEIGNLERDSIAIHNKGNQYGMVARDFAYLSQMAKKYGVKVEVFLYDKHADNPYAQSGLHFLTLGVHRNPNGWIISYGKVIDRRAENGAIQYHFSFDDYEYDFTQIISGQIFPNDQNAQFRKEEIERGNNGLLANTFRFKAPSSEWPKSFGPAPEDLLRIGKPLPNLQLAISQ